MVTWKGKVVSARIRFMKALKRGASDRCRIFVKISSIIGVYFRLNKIQVLLLNTHSGLTVTQLQLLSPLFLRTDIQRV